MAMDDDKVTVAIFSLALLACLLGAAWLFSANQGLSAKLDALNRTSSQKLSQAQSDYLALNTRYASAQKELAATGALLEAEKARLALAQAQLAQAQLALNESRASLELQRQKAAEIASSLSELESSINESMSWFRENARMPENHSWAAGIFMERAASDCVDRGALNLACLSHLMENTAFAIHYREDAQSSGRDDFLQGVKQTIDSGWGDCEDYSLLVKAILNSLRGQNAGLSAVAWQPAESGDFRVYPKETPGETGPYWVYGNAKAARLGPLAHPYVICYSVDASSGHCAVAISPAAINSSAQVPFLEGAQAFEPQNGRYLGRLGESLSLCNGSGCKQQGGKIWMVISDSDLYIHGGSGWEGYADSLAQAQQARAGLPA